MIRTPLLHLFRLMMALSLHQIVLAEPFSSSTWETNGNQKTVKYGLVICAVFQNEAFFLREWLEYHRLVGVEHFYLYNHLSDDSSIEILQPYIKKGLVDLINWPAEVNSQREYLELLQLPAYTDALKKVKETADWAAFIDLDEFLVPVIHDNLQEMLAEYSSFAAIAVNWQVFGTSDIDTLPSNELIIENLVKRAPERQPINETVKLIVQPDLVESIPNPHSFSYYSGFYAVNSNKEPLESGRMGQPVIVDTVQINHYWFGPLDWFIQCKIPRREKWGIRIRADHLKEIESLFNREEDSKIQRFTSPLKKIMFSNPL